MYDFIQRCEPSPNFYPITFKGLMLSTNLHFSSLFLTLLHDGDQVQ